VERGDLWVLAGDCRVAGDAVHVHVFFLVD
jgi:hypothetical protein